MRERTSQTKQVKNNKPTAKTEAATKNPMFAPGQKWLMERGHAEIIQVGKTLVHYKFLKHGMVRGALEMKSIANFAEAMKTNKATLVANGSR